MLEPAVFNMVVVIGAVWSSPSFCIEMNGEPKNLTWCSVEFKVFDEDNDLVLNLTDGNGLSILSSTGVINIDVPAKSTSTLKKGYYHYQLWITETDPLDKNLYIFGVMEATI